MAVRPTPVCTIVALTATISVTGMLLAAEPTAQPREFRVYPSFEGEDAAAPLPPDWKIPGELVLGRLMYPSRGFGFFGGDWRQGGTSWTDDYPRGDRTMIQMLRR